jgi:hypothetical protein
LVKTQEAKASFEAELVQSREKLQQQWIESENERETQAVQAQRQCQALSSQSEQLAESRRRVSKLFVHSQLESKSQVRKVCDKINLIYQKSIDDGTIGWQPWNASLLDNDTYQSTVDIFFEGIPKTARHLGILYRYPSEFEDWTDPQIKHAIDSYLADL